MKNYIKAKALQDETGTWYVVPDEEYDLFNSLQEKMMNGEEDYEDIFNETFSPYQTGGDLNSTQLYIHI